MPKTWTQFRHSGGHRISLTGRDSSSWLFLNAPSDSPGPGHTFNGKNSTRERLRGYTMALTPRMQKPPACDTPGPETSVHGELTPRTSSNGGKLCSFSKQPRFPVNGRGKLPDSKPTSGEGVNAPFYLTHEDWSQKRIKNPVMSQSARNTGEHYANLKQAALKEPSPGDYWDSVQHSSKTAPRLAHMASAPRDTTFYLHKKWNKDVTPSPGHYKQPSLRNTAGRSISRARRDPTPSHHLQRMSDPGPGAYDPMCPADHAKSRLTRNMMSTTASVGSQDAPQIRFSSFHPAPRTSCTTPHRWSNRMEELAKPRRVPESGRPWSNLAPYALRGQEPLPDERSWEETVIDEDELPELISPREVADMYQDELAGGTAAADADMNSPDADAVGMSLEGAVAPTSSWANG